MNLQDVISSLKQLRVEAFARMTKEPGAYDEFLSGRVSAFDSALYFLDDPETVARVDSFVADRVAARAAEVEA